MATSNPVLHFRPPVTTFTDRTGNAFTPRFQLRPRDYEFLTELMSRSNTELFVITDPLLADNGLVYASPSFCEHTGYEIDDILYRNCRFLQGPLTDTNDIGAIRSAVAAQSEVIVRLLNYRRDGTVFVNQFFLTTLRKYVPKRFFHVKLRPWVVRAVTRIRTGPGIDELSPEAMKVNRREKLRNVYYVGVLCKCDTAKRTMVLNFGARFRSLQPFEDKHDEEHALRLPTEILRKRSLAEGSTAKAGSKIDQSTEKGTTDGSSRGDEVQQRLMTF
uniref:Putative LOV domain-containing protein n=1 Tax=Rhodochaete parvula TaxID=110510 RepID=A0A126WYH8_9RHOD|nr:putative LOV domain-containing protein [Rhodochaete parvula]